MSLRSIGSAVLKHLAAARGRRRDMRVLGSMNAHMLKDIGLRWEADNIVPFNPAPVENAPIERAPIENAPVENAQEARRSRGLVREKIIDDSHASDSENVVDGAWRKDSPSENDSNVFVCRHCGERLA